MLQTKYTTLTYNLYYADSVELKITVSLVLQFHVCNILCQLKKQRQNIILYQLTKRLPLPLSSACGHPVLQLVLPRNSPHKSFSACHSDD